MNSLADRRKISDGTFMYKLTNDLIDVPELRTCINVNRSSYETRHRQPLIVINHSTSYGKNEPLTRMLYFHNEFYYIFNDSISVTSFKTKIREISC